MGDHLVRARPSTGLRHRWVRSVLPTCLIVTVLLGCAGATGSTLDGDPVAATGPGGDAVAEERVLELWFMPNGSDPEAMITTEVAHFEALHPGIRVNATMIGWEEALTKLATATVSGEGPDVTQVGSTWVAGLAQTGAFRPFSERDIDRFGGRGTFVDESWTSTLAADGSTVAVPWMVDTRVLYYRTDVFAELGIDPQVAFSDWEGFEVALQTIEDGTELHPLGIPGRNDWNVVHNATPWIWAAGGAILDDDGTGSVLDGPEAVQGLHEFQRLVARYGHPGALTSTDAESQELFAAGEFAITLSGPWFEGIIRAEHGDSMPSEWWSASAVPAGPAGRVSFLGGSHLAVFDGSEHPEDALTLVAHFTARDAQERSSAYTGLLPANTSVERSSGAVADAFDAALASGRQYPSVPIWLDVETILQRSFSTMWRGVESDRTPMSPLTPAQIDRLLREASADIDDALDAAAD